MSRVLVRFTDAELAVFRAEMRLMGWDYRERCEALVGRLEAAERCAEESLRYVRLVRGGVDTELERAFWEWKRVSGK